MAALFPRWSNSVLQALLFLAASAAVGVPLFIWVLARTPYNTGVAEERTQPVLFDHRHHVGDDGIDCRYCHFAAEREAYAGVPPVAVCMNCHSQIWSDSVLLQPVRADYFSGQTLAWNRVSSVPDFVFFNHAIHVQRAVGCFTCHGRVDLMAAVRKAQPLNMGWCLDCHRDPAPNLRPASAVTDMQWAPAEPRALGTKIKGELKINPPTNCTGCHR